MIEEKDVKVRMRDGVDIGLRIYRPDGSGRHQTASGRATLP